MSFTSFTQSYRSYTSSVDTEPSAQNLSIMDSHVSPHEMISKLEGSDDLNEWEHDKFVLLSEILERFRPDDDVAEEWVVTFIEDGGVETLVNQLLNLALVSHFHKVMLENKMCFVLGKQIGKLSCAFCS